MKFGINSVHTVFSTEGLKVGSRGYFADSLEEVYNLEKDISKNNAAPALHTLTGIDLEQQDCFTDEEHNSHLFFYFVEDPAVKEVTSKEWDNRPRLMKVWDEDYTDNKKVRVVYIIPEEEKVSYPVVACISHQIYGGHIICYKHCAELEPAKEAKEPEAEKHYRSYNNADEFIEDYKRRFCPDFKSIPAIWVKNAMDTPRQVIAIADNGVRLVGKRNFFVDYSDFLDVYTYPDGSPCGMEE